MEINEEILRQKLKEHHKDKKKATLQSWRRVTPLELDHTVYSWVSFPGLFADGGLVASKPYASSGSYINRMSDYCKNCAYDVHQKNGPLACPFNYLYWDFMIRNKPLLENNQRLKLVYNRIKLFDEEKLKNIKTDSQNLKKEIFKHG